MAHAGEEVILRPVQFLNFLFLTLREGVFLFVHFVQKHEQYTGEQSHHNHGKRGIKQGGMLAVWCGKGGKVKGRAVAKHGFYGTQPEEYDPAPSLQRDADVNKTEDKPLRHTAVKTAGGEKGNRKQDKQQHGDERGACVDALCLNTDLGYHCHGSETDH